MASSSWRFLPGFDFRIIAHLSFSSHISWANMVPAPFVFLGSLDSGWEAQACSAVGFFKLRLKLGTRFEAAASCLQRPGACDLEGLVWVMEGTLHLNKAGPVWCCFLRPMCAWNNSTHSCARQPPEAASNEWRRQGLAALSLQSRNTAKKVLSYLQTFSLSLSLALSHTYTHSPISLIYIQTNYLILSPTHRHSHTPQLAWFSKPEAASNYSGALALFWAGLQQIKPLKILTIV